MKFYYMADKISQHNYSSLHVYELCGDEVCREFFSEPNSGPHELNRS